MPQLRHILLGSALVATLVASVWDLPGQGGADGDEAAAAAARQGNAAMDKSAAGAGHTAPGARMHATRANAFASYSWLPPVPKTKPPPAPPPRAPVLPFAYLGKMQDGNAVTVFVSQGTRNHVLHSGDTLPGYRVESITPTDMTFVYLPLGEKQRLTFGSAN